MIKSYAFRLTLAIALTIVCATGLVLATGGWLIGDRHLRKMDWWLSEESRLIADMIKSAKPGLTPAGVIEHVASKTTNIGDHTLYFIQIGNADGEVLYRSANLGTAFLSPCPGNGSHWTGNLPNISNMRITETAVGEWRIRVCLPMDGREVILDSYITVSLMLMGATIIGSMLVGYFFSRRMLAPIYAIEKSARSIRSHNLHERVYVPENNRELASLATVFNSGLDDLEKAFAQIRRFTADASHELNTPLTLIHLNAEKLRKYTSCATADPESDALLSNLLEEADGMKRIIESLLFIARADAGALNIEIKPRDMQAFITEFSEDAGILAEDKEVRLEVSRNAPGSPAFDPDSVRRLLLNLTSNAIAVTPAGGKVSLESGPAPQGRWRLSVADEGCGLPENELEHVFKRFWRYQQGVIARSTKLPQGHGLGLSICKSIATLHGGTIHAENRADRAGLRIIFEW